MSIILGKNANFENKALYMAQMTSSNYEVMKKCRMATYFPFSHVLPLAFIYTPSVLKYKAF
jgi:hypothetical protein